MPQASLRRVLLARLAKQVVKGARKNSLLDFFG